MFPTERDQRVVNRDHGVSEINLEVLLELNF